MRQPAPIFSNQRQGFPEDKYAEITGRYTYVEDAIECMLDDCGLILPSNTITMHQLENWDDKAKSLVVFEDRQRISRPILARLSDVADRQFSGLDANKDDICKHIIGELAP